MCAIDWQMLLEYIKVLLSWPPIALAIALLFISRFRGAIDDFLKRLVEGNIFGQAFKAVPPPHNPVRLAPRRIAWRWRPRQHHHQRLLKLSRY